MRSFSLAATTLFAATAWAGNLNQLVPRELQVRQDQSFTPTTSFGQGATCADAFGAGYIDCNGVCYNPGQGETCCPGAGDAYPCPSDSFCLINGLCCPDVTFPFSPLLPSPYPPTPPPQLLTTTQGLPASTCAAQNGVTLPEGFSTATATVDGKSTSQAPKPTVSAVESSASSSSAFVPSTTAVVATPYPIPGNGTAPAASGTAGPTGTGMGTGPSTTPFLGAAGSVKVYAEGVVIGFVGAVAMLL
ncbi:MAG: hypothetical protein Q9170_008172 [Blastenia crenularia]